MNEALSTRRPSRLRLLGFLALATGSVLLGVGAVSTWGTIGFTPQVDPEGVLTAVVPGIDLWEGVLVLAAALVVLLGLVAMRVARRIATKRLVAVVVTVVAFGAAALAATAALRAEDRLGRTEGLDAVARVRADALGISFEQARKDVEEVFGDQLVTEVGPGVWLSVAGGILAGIGGVLSIAWVRELEREQPPEPQPPRPIFA